MLELARRSPSAERGREQLRDGARHNAVDAVHVAILTTTAAVIAVFADFATAIGIGISRARAIDAGASTGTETGPETGYHIVIAIATAITTTVGVDVDAGTGAAAAIEAATSLHVVTVKRRGRYREP